MSILTQAETPPLREDVAGALRVGDSNVLFELVIRAFQEGATPETIVQRYATLSLADAYASVAHYLRHRGEVETYLAERESLAAAVKQQIEGVDDLSDIRARLQTHGGSPGR